MSRQGASGAFGLWAADSDDDDPWLDAFVTDFLTRARERDFAVPQEAFDQALDRLRNAVVNAPEPDKDKPQALAYALYVLARNGRPVIGDLRYLSDAKLDAFTTPLAKAQIAAALAMLGDRARAGKVFAAALAALEAESDQRRLAARLWLAPARRGGRARAPGRSESHRRRHRRATPIARAGAAVEEARAERSYTSTQEKNWMVLAAEALAEHARLGQFSVDGQPVKGAFNRRWSGAALAEAVADRQYRHRTRLSSSRRFRARRSRPDPAVAHGYAIERTFYKLDGTKTDSEKHRPERARRRRAEGDGVRRRATRNCSSSTGCPPGSRSTIRRWSTAARSRASRG